MDSEKAIHSSLGGKAAIQAVEYGTLHTLSPLWQGAEQLSSLHHWTLPDAKSYLVSLQGAALACSKIGSGVGSTCELLVYKCKQ